MSDVTQRHQLMTLPPRRPCVGTSSPSSSELLQVTNQPNSWCLLPMRHGVASPVETHVQAAPSTSSAVRLAHHGWDQSRKSCNPARREHLSHPVPTPLQHHHPSREYTTTSGPATTFGARDAFQSNHAYRRSSMEEIFIDTSPTGW